MCLMLLVCLDIVMLLWSGNIDPLLEEEWNRSVGEYEKEDKEGGERDEGGERQGEREDKEGGR